VGGSDIQTGEETARTKEKQKMGAQYPTDKPGCPHPRGKGDLKTTIQKPLNVCLGDEPETKKKKEKKKKKSSP